MNIDREGRFDMTEVKSVDGKIPKLLAKGDVLFNNTNSPELIGKTALISINSPLAFSNHMTRIRLENGMNSAFVARQLHYLWISGYFRHRCKNHVNQASIAAEPLAQSVPLLVPPPKEQERIADTLDELLSDLDAGVAALERVRAKLKHYRAAVLKAAVEGALTAEWRRQHPAAEPAGTLLARILAERRRRWEAAQLAKFQAVGKSPPKDWRAKYSEPAAPDTSILPQLPAGWCWATPRQLGNVQLGRQRAPQHHHGEFMRPYLRVANVYEDHIDLNSVYEMNFSPAEFESYELQSGDILLNEGQSLELVGRSAIYRDELPGACFTNTLVRFRPDKGMMAEFAQTYFRACLRNHRFRKIARWTTNIAHLGADRFAVMEFPLPPLDEQAAIVEAVEDQLSVIDHLEDDLEAKLKSAQALRHSILRHAFTGQLVPQDPSDEPASELLKSIADEREERAREARAATQAKHKLRAPRRRAARN
jgi:type I restriction enzyme S subunit